jgi:hypothetical protein
VNDNLADVDEVGKEFFERIIRPKIVAGPELHWGQDYPTETHTVFVSRPGKKRIMLKISRDALDQANDEPAKRPRLASEIEQQLKVSESGKTMGYVRAIEG